MAQIVINIPDDKVEKFKEAFLAVRPIPIDESGNPTMVPNAWIQSCGKFFYFHTYQQGIRKLVEKEFGVDENFLE